METPPPPTETSLSVRIGWLVLIIATLYVCYFSHLGALGLVGPDEPRYAWIARAMAETGDWITPRLYDHPWFEKPPLYYWGAALSFKLFGVSEAAARLPSAGSALLATLALAWLALRIYGAETARWLLLLLPTTVGMIGFSHAAATDMPFSAMLTIAMVASAVLMRLIPDRTSSPPVSGRESSSRQSPSRATFTHSTFFVAIVFGLFLGLAVLAKGPAAIILCGGSVFFWAVVTKRCVLPHRAALVCSLRPSQSRLLPHFHHRTQFQALPHARISTRSALVVLLLDSDHRHHPVDELSVLVRFFWNRAAVFTQVFRFGTSVDRDVVFLTVALVLSRVFLRFTIQATWLHLARNSSGRIAAGTLVHLAGP
jgi:hypothetical protein